IHVACAGPKSIEAPGLIVQSPVSFSAPNCSTCTMGFDELIRVCDGFEPHEGGGRLTPFDETLRLQLEKLRIGDAAFSQLFDELIQQIVLPAVPKVFSNLLH